MKPQMIQKDIVPNLIILSGFSGSGKSLLMEYLLQKENVAAVPKYTTRNLRSNEESPMSFVGKIPSECDFKYSIYNSEYGISTSSVQDIFSKGRHAVVIIGPIKEVVKLKDKLRPNVKAIWIDRPMEVEKRLSILKDRTSGLIELRLNKLKQMDMEYTKHLDLFDFTIENSSSIKWIYGQIEAFMESLSGKQVPLFIPAFIPQSAIPVITSDILLATQEIKEYFAKHPEKLHNLNGREFEIFVSEIFRDMGFVVDLTPGSKDGGFDIRILDKKGIIPFMCLVECKKYSSSNPVGIEIVRSLNGVLSTSDANAAALVTTSHFTKGALAFQRRLGYKMSLHDYNNLKSWLKTYEKKYGTQDID